MHTTFVCEPVCAPKTAITHTDRLRHTSSHEAVARVDIVAFLSVTWVVETCPTVELSMPGQPAWVSGCSAAM